MRAASAWEPAGHTISLDGMVNIRFSTATLRKLQRIAQIRKKAINALVNEFVKPFVDSEFALLQRLK